MVLDGIHNILKMAGEDVEPVANNIEECGGTLSLTLNDNDHGSQFSIDKSWYKRVGEKNTWYFSL